MGNSEDLKPCPFCGSAASVREEDRGEDGLWEVWVVGCVVCPAEMVGDRSEGRMLEVFADEKVKTINEWNKRI